RENRTVEATKKAISSPLLEVNISGAKQVLLNITGGPDLSLFEAQDASQIVADAAKDDVNIIFGTSINEELGDEVVVTVIATGIEEEDQRRESSRRPAAQTRGADHDKGNDTYRPAFAGNDQHDDQSAQSDDPFGNWDLRREPSKRQTPSSDDMNNVKKKDFDIFENQTNADDAGSDDQPPFFKRRRQ
ncbi:MAG TPA: cell division protein FtsZ, partial [Lactobacillus sp.]|nr:cell division protein FtsZ [Lactobacillus sp.]